MIEKAIELLKAGEIVALPTETVYGLAGDAGNDTAVAKIYAAKGRPSFNPLIVHVYDFAAAEKIGVFSKAAKKFAKKYWPGPLTIVVPKRDKKFAALATAGLDTIAIRVPAHPIMREVLKSGLMLAAPSANISGKLTPTEAKHVAENFPHIYIVEGGKCEVGLESTVITFDEHDNVIVLREGVLQIEDVRGRSRASHQPAERCSIGGPGGPHGEHKKIISPGQLLKHYAPKNPIRINADSPQPNETFIGFGNMKCDFNLSERGSLIEAAANLFSMLHAADALNKPIAVAPIPNEEVGAAINDRLTRSSHK